MAWLCWKLCQYELGQAKEEEGREDMALAMDSILTGKEEALSRE